MKKFALLLIVLMLLLLGAFSRPLRGADGFAGGQASAPDKLMKERVHD